MNYLFACRSAHYRNKKTNTGIDYWLRGGIILDVNEKDYYKINPFFYGMQFNNLI